MLSLRVAGVPRVKGTQAPAPVQARATRAAGTARIRAGTRRADRSITVDRISTIVLISDHAYYPA